MATIIGYTAAYYALASSPPLTLANYFIIGRFNGYLDSFYMDSCPQYGRQRLFFIAILRYRLNQRSFFGALLESFK